MSRTATVGPASHANSLLGASAWAQDVREQIGRCAEYDSTVLITGPTGTGKEVIARYLHQQSRRSQGPLIPVDCTTISGALFASQLFGHRRGAFTGADYEALGSFRAAQRGTIFLDEIGEIGPNLQAALLRVVQERTVTPVGAHQPVPVDVRIVAATNRDLKRDVATGRFREDLYFRLNVMCLETKPLRERLEDIPILAEHFLEQLSTLGGFPRKRLSPGAIEQLSMFSWPGNIRQLRHMLERALIATDGETINLAVVQALLEQARLPVIDDVVRGTRSHDQGEVTRDSQRTEAAASTVAESAIPPARLQKDVSWSTLAKLEREHIRNTLEHAHYNQSASARLLGISRQALLRKIKRHAIEMPLATPQPVH